MPHTTRKNKKQPPKRVQVTDEDGWTTVTTTNGSQKLKPRNANTLNTTPSPAPPDPGVTLEKLKQQYTRQETLWLASEASGALSRLVKGSVCPAVDVDKVIIFGSGSTCGGWRRCDVALTQLSILKSIGAAVESITGTAPPMYTQDPTYNALDKELLSSLGYEVVEDPAGFELITGKSLVYTPGAEFHVEMDVLRKGPGVLVTGRLDWYWRNSKGTACTNRASVLEQRRRGKSDVVCDVEEEKRGVEEAEAVQADISVDKDEDIHERHCQIFEAYRGSKSEALLPTFEEKDYPFYRQYLYWPKSMGADGDDVADELGA